MPAPYEPAPVKRVGIFGRPTGGGQRNEKPAGDPTHTTNSEARELLDAYAEDEETVQDGWTGGYESQPNCVSKTLDEIAPKAFDALRAVLDLHKPAPLTAPVRTPIKESGNECLFCGKLDLIEERRDGAGFLWHDHFDSMPNCAGCATQVTFTPWPCDTVDAIETALRGGVDR